MNVGEVLDTVEQTLLSRQLSSLERFILCQSWVGRGYSEMAPDCAYSIAHIKDMGSQLWQALSKAIGQRVTKKNLFLVLKQYLLSQTVQRGVGDRVQGVERGEDEDCNLTLPPSSQLTLLPLEQSVEGRMWGIGMRRTGDCSPSQRQLLLQEDGACYPLVVGAGCSPTPHILTKAPAHPTPAPMGRPESVNLELAETIDPPLTPENTEVENNKDASLIQSEGLLSGSFRPEDRVCVLPSYIRQRNSPIESASIHIQKLKALILVPLLIELPMPFGWRLKPQAKVIPLMVHFFDARIWGESLAFGLWAKEVYFASI
ncbi:MAG TPA: hypothetical protein DDW76_28335 [Cyanobacteria bacterium UBA11369]|nr:hypothetical protein [Cyanobacteria bacterium UBA11371]HBE36148.1 hypothetical protein [Cyanobacteria bacterium UBA11368]HBE52570.1 hypothetical protein [Cyanobacteria bacterium UBA11369]